MVGKSYLCFAVWSRQVLVDLPALMLLECVPGFCMSALDRFKKIYDVCALDFSPVDLGIPSARPRKYMLLRHLVKTTAHADLEIVFPEVFSGA